MKPSGAIRVLPEIQPSVPAEILDRVRGCIAGLETPFREDIDAKLQDGLSAGGVSNEALTTLLMEIFARTRDLDGYSLLYELSHRQILLVILKRLRFAHPSVDPKDVLQDVFLSIYRYPHRFRNEKASSFRNWSFSIVRNTLLKHLRATQRVEVELDPLEEIVEDERVRGPLYDLQHHEETKRASESYMLCLMAYADSFQTELKEREQKALRLIEVDGFKYRRAAEELDVRVENLKMIVCRARKKLLRSMVQMLEVQRDE